MREEKGALMPNAPDAFVHNHGSGFKVDPPVAWVTHAGGFGFGNATRWPAMLRFPGGVIAGWADPARQAELEKLFPGLLGTLLAQSIPVDANSRIKLEFEPDAPKDIEYIVTVYTDHGPVDAPGSSPPRIIVDP